MFNLKSIYPKNKKLKKFKGITSPNSLLIDTGAKDLLTI